MKRLVNLGLDPEPHEVKLSSMVRKSKVSVHS
jgi:hypothetical protein